MTTHVERKGFHGVPPQKPKYAVRALSLWLWPSEHDGSAAMSAQTELEEVIARQLTQVELDKLALIIRSLSDLLGMALLREAEKATR